jgi:hypothetical protein
MPRHRDHNDVIGNIPEGSPTSAWAVERNLPLSRAYDGETELARVRAVLAREASMPERRVPQPFHRRSLRRV